MEKEIIDDSMCFVCGEKNPIGMKTRFHLEGDRVYMLFNLEKNYQGWGDVVHGGFQSMLLDEVQVQTAGYKGYKTVTAEMTVRFKKPVLCGCDYKSVGKIEKVSSTVIETSAEIVDKDGVVYAVSTARLRVLGQWHGDMKID